MRGPSLGQFPVRLRYFALILALFFFKTAFKLASRLQFARCGDHERRGPGWKRLWARSRTPILPYIPEAPVGLLLTLQVHRASLHAGR